MEFKLYRFSPIKTKNEMVKAIEHIHFEERTSAVLTFLVQVIFLHFFNSPKSL